VTPAPLPQRPSEFDFDGTQLSEAISATFRRRKTALPADFLVALSPDFSGNASKQRQWLLLSSAGG